MDRSRGCKFEMIQKRGKPNGFPLFLYLHVKSVLAARTVDRMFSLLLWETELIAAGGTLAEHMRFSVFEFGSSETKIISDFSKKPAKCRVFALSFVNVPREKAE